uniref:Uncharacterized protein n=1 Tax=Photinus pyralis TaxID=7054 RepID=A0A1Y1LKA4_PHOPY
MIANTAVGIRSQTLAVMITIIVPISIRNIWKKSIIAIGSSSSMAPISLEKRLKILPDGFVLKKRMVALLMLSNILSCNLMDDFIQTVKNINDRDIANVTVAAIIPI